MLVTEENKREKIMSRCELSQDIVPPGGITGCSRKQNPDHNKTHFKYQYNRDELK